MFTDLSNTVSKKNPYRAFLFYYNGHENNSKNIRKNCSLT